MESYKDVAAIAEKEDDILLSKNLWVKKNLSWNLQLGTLFLITSDRFCCDKTEC